MIAVVPEQDGVRNAQFHTAAGRTGKFSVVFGPPVPEDGPPEADKAERPAENGLRACRGAREFVHGNGVRTGAVQAAHGDPYSRQVQALESVGDGMEKFVGMLYGDAFAHIAQVEHDDAVVRRNVASPAFGGRIQSFQRFHRVRRAAAEQPYHFVGAVQRRQADQDLSSGADVSGVDSFFQNSGSSTSAAP